MLIDIYTDRNEHNGTADKRTAHQQGLWHRTFSCLAYNPAAGTVLLQKKNPSSLDFDRPDYADFTVGGHYEADESIPDGIRELHEELGLHLPYSSLHPLGIRQTAVTLSPDRIEHEFQYWHLAPLDIDLKDIPLDDAEVDGLVELDLTDAIALAADNTAHAPARFLTRTDGSPHHITDGQLARTDLIPGYLSVDQLYLRLFIAARRHQAGERHHLFW
ncbi:NUDIX hydrolase [Streptomyces sp. NPDC002671]